jgi:hypothetical protein
MSLLVSMQASSHTPGKQTGRRYCNVKSAPKTRQWTSQSSSGLSGTRQEIGSYLMPQGLWTAELYKLLYAARNQSGDVFCICRRKAKQTKLWCTTKHPYTRPALKIMGTFWSSPPWQTLRTRSGLQSTTQLRPWMLS